MNQILLCLVGLVVLAVAADHLVLGSSRLAARLRVNPVVVGVVVIGIGTSTPEFLVSGSAAARGDAGIALGNLVGSNIINLLLILAVGALIAPIRVAAGVVRREARLSVVGVLVFAVFAWLGLDLVGGLVLATLCAGALALLVRWARAGLGSALAHDVEEFTGEGGLDPLTQPPGLGGESGRLPVEALRAIGGLAGVLVGAQLLVVNASTLAERAGVSPIVIGFTLVALGTSLPELVTTVQAQRRGESDLVVGNLFGSNLFNSLGGGAVVGLISGRAPAPPVGPATLAVMGLSSLLAWGLLRRGLRLDRWEGAVLLATYLVTLPLLLTT